MFNVASEPLNSTIIRLSGEYDISNADTHLLSELEVARTATHVVLDFSDVSYIDSSGITQLVRMHKQRDANGLAAAHLAALQPNVRYIFELVSLDRFLKVFDTVEDAVAAFDGSP